MIEDLNFQSCCNLDLRFSMKKFSSVASSILSNINKQQISISNREAHIINLAGALTEIPLDKTKDLGFMSRLLVMVNLPYRDTGIETRNWWRTNGSISINITPGYEGSKSLGIPYGSYPRLIMAYLITQAIKKKSPIINLGKSFKEFLEMIGLEKGGKQYRQLQKQLGMMLSASFSWTYSNEKLWSRINIQVSNQSQLWWDPKSPDQLSLWDSYITLNTDFFNEVTRNPVPVDLRILKLLKNSPLGLDLYMFLAWRTFNLKKPALISWVSLHNQLGGQYTNVKEFARNCRQHLKRIKAIWPELDIEPVKGRLRIKPTSSGLVSV